MLDLEVLDPDWKFAEIHGMASHTGFVDYDAQKQSSVLICKCCLNIVHQKPLSLCAHIKQLEFLGFGFPLFYFFLKNCILLLIISIASYNAMSLYLGVVHNVDLCQDPKINCTTFMVILARNQKVVTEDQNILRIIGFTTYFIFLIYMRNYMVKKDNYYKERNTDISDYSIIIKNIPKLKEIKKRIRKFFASSFKRPHQLKQITLLTLDHQIEKLKQEKMKIIKKLKKEYKKNIKDPNYEIQGKKQLQEINAKLNLQYENYKGKLINDQIETSRAIVIVESEQEKDEILNEFKIMKNLEKVEHFGVGGISITMKTAPEPKEIIWQNMFASNPRFHFLRLLNGYFWTLVILTIVTILFFFALRQKGAYVKAANKDYNKDKAQFQAALDGAIALVYIMLFLIIIFNKLILVEIIHKFVHLEKHTTTAGYQFSFATKYCLALFFTTALMTLAVEAIALENFNTYLYGVIDEETVMFFLNSGFVPLFWLINPKNLMKKFRRKKYYGRADITQAQANYLMEQTPYDIGKRYAQTIEIMWFTSLYSSLIPIGAFVSLLGILMYYWVDRYNLQRRSTLKYQVSGKMIDFALKLLDISLLLRPAGQIFFDQYIRNGFQISSIVMLVVAFIYQLLPMNKIIQKIQKQSFKMEQKKYSEVRFKNTYHNLHPLEKRIDFQNIRQNIGIMNYSFPRQTKQEFTDRPLKSQPNPQRVLASFLRPGTDNGDNQLQVHSNAY